MSAREPTNPPSSTAGQVTSSTYCFPHASAPGRSLRACRSLWESRSWFASPSLPLARSLCSFPVPSFFPFFSPPFPRFLLILLLFICFGLVKVYFGRPPQREPWGGWGGGGRWRQQPGPPRTPGGSGAPRRWNGRPEPPGSLASALPGSTRPGPAGLGWPGGDRGRTALHRGAAAPSVPHTKGPAREEPFAAGGAGPGAAERGRSRARHPAASPPSRSALPPGPGAARPPPVTMAPPPRRGAGPGRRGSGARPLPRLGRAHAAGGAAGSWGDSVRPSESFPRMFGKVGVRGPVCPGSPLRLIRVELQAESVVSSPSRVVAIAQSLWWHKYGVIHKHVPENRKQVESKAHKLRVKWNTSSPGVCPIRSWCSGLAARGDTGDRMKEGHERRWLNWEGRKEGQENGVGKMKRSSISSEQGCWQRKVRNPLGSRRGIDELNKV